MIPTENQAFPHTKYIVTESENTEKQQERGG